jgi:hypothetical protein
MTTQKTSNNRVNEGMIRVVCSKCKNDFGLNTRFVEKMGEVNFHYQCPYCKHESGIKEN